MALAGIWTVSIAMMAEMGLGAAIIQFRDLDDTDLNSCFWFTMMFSVAGYLALYVAAPTIAAWFSSPVLSDVLRVVGIALPITAFRIVPDSLLRKRLALDKISQAEIAAAIVIIPITLGLAYAGVGVWALVAAAIVGPLTQSALIFWFVRWWPGMKIWSTRFREVLSFSGATLGTRMCWTLREQADVLVLGKISGDMVLGFYSMAKELATLPGNKVSGVVNQLAIPMMAELQTNQEMSRALFLRATRLVSSITFPLCFALILLANDLVRVALSDKWLPAVPVLQVLCLYAAVRSVDVLFPPVLLARYRANFLFGYALILLGVMPIAFWIGAVEWGAMGVALAWVVVYPIVMLWMARVALSELKVSWKLLFKQLWAPLAATMVMITAVWIVRFTTASWGNDLVLERLAMMGAVAIASYGVSLAAMSPLVWQEIKEIGGWVIRRTPMAQAIK
jgi:O-antigen/teichoic acid export membrane protein